MPVNANGEWEGVDSSIKPYAAREMTLSLERRFNSRFTIGARYTRKDLLRAIEDIGVLDANDNEVYIVGNPGFGFTRDPSSLYGATTPNGQEWLVPRAKRQYDALELRAEGKIRRYSMLASYTYQPAVRELRGISQTQTRRAEWIPASRGPSICRRIISTARAVSGIQKDGWQQIVRMYSSFSGGAIFRTGSVLKQLRFDTTCNVRRAGLHHRHLHDRAYVPVRTR